MESSVHTESTNVSFWRVGWHSCFPLQESIEKRRLWVHPGFFSRGQPVLPSFFDDLRDGMWEAIQILFWRVLLQGRFDSNLKSHKIKLFSIIFIRPFYIITLFLASFSHQRFIIRILSDSKSPKIFRTFLCILANLTNVVVWMVSIRPLISKSNRTLCMVLEIVPSAPITANITITNVFHSILRSFITSKYLFYFLLSLFHSVFRWDLNIY